jgi:hypothetical protein
VVREKDLKSCVEQLSKREFGKDTPNASDRKICKQLLLCEEAVANFVDGMTDKDFQKKKDLFQNQWPPSTTNPPTSIEKLQFLTALAKTLSPKSATDEKNRKFQATIKKILESA